VKELLYIPLQSSAILFIEASVTRGSSVVTSIISKKSFGLVDIGRGSWRSVYIILGRKEESSAIVTIIRVIRHLLFGQVFFF
jgi:hypothetical protein